MYRRINNSRRGTVLLMTLLISGIIAMVSLSFGDSVRNQMTNARHVAIALQADLSAQSGVEFARRRLALDPTWEGTDGQTIQINEGIYFSISRMPGEVSEYSPTTVSFLVKGMAGEGRADLMAEIYVEPGDPVRTKALSVLGGSLSGINVEIKGDAMWLEDDSIRWVYRPGPLSSNSSGHHLSDLSRDGVWIQIYDQRPKPDLTVQRMNLSGRLWTAHGLDNWSEDIEEELEQPVHVPGWDFEGYLEDSDCIKVFNGNRRLEGVFMRKTAVFVLEPGETLTLVNCKLLGGVVVWVESGWDPQEGPRNHVILKGTNVIGGDPKCSGNLGLMAPASRVMTMGKRRQVIHGMNLWHSAWMIRRLESRGLAVILDDLHGIRDCSFDFDIGVAQNPPDGVLFFGHMPEIDVVSVQEHYGF
jgi:hypothetical protein